MNQGTPSDGGLAGLRVLVVEDEALISMLLEEALDELGCTVVGPCQSLSSALAAADEGGFDVALVDFTLRGEQATPLAGRLLELGLPFAIASGGGAEVEGHGESALLRKPFIVEDVESVLLALIVQSGARG